MSLEINFKEKEITMIEDIVYTSKDGQEQTFVDMQEFNGVIDPMDARHIKFDHKERSRHLEIIGKDEEILGILRMPFASQFEDKPTAENMKDNAISELLVNDPRLRYIMGEILDASNKGNLTCNIDLVLVEDYRRVLTYLGYRIDNSTFSNKLGVSW